MFTKYWFFIDWENFARGHVYGMHFPDGRWAHRIIDLQDAQGNDLPPRVTYTGTDEAAVFDFMNQFPDLEDEYKWAMIEYINALESLEEL